MRLLKSKGRRTNSLKRKRTNKFISDYNNLIEEQDRKRKANKSSVAINKSFSTSKNKDSISLKIGERLHESIYNARTDSPNNKNDLKDKNTSLKFPSPIKRKNIEYKNFLESQIRDKAKAKEIEMQNNKWFAVQQLDDVSNYKSKEKINKDLHRKKEVELKDFLESQIQHKRNISQREVIGKYGSRGMNQEEYSLFFLLYILAFLLYLINRKLLLDINNKKTEIQKKIDIQKSFNNDFFGTINFSNQNIDMYSHKIK